MLYLLCAYYFGCVARFAWVKLLELIVSAFGFPPFVFSAIQNRFGHRSGRARVAVCLPPTVALAREKKKRSMQSFTELTISPYTQERLAAARFAIPTPVQAAAIPEALAGKDVLATAQTGTGKTLAFLIPIIEHLLQKDDSGNRRPGAGSHARTRHAGGGPVQRPARKAAWTRGPGGGRFVRSARSSTPCAKVRAWWWPLPAAWRITSGRKLINFRSLRILVLDEADRMLDMGFLPAIRRIVASLPKERQTMCFSATMAPEVVRLVNDYQRNAVRLTFGSTVKPHENVRVQAFEVAHDQKQQVLERLLTREKGRCLVFARTKRGTERLAKNLVRQGFAAAMIHGDRTQSQRSAALAGFQRGNVRILVATDVASRGIHVQDIAHVINYDLPGDAESFIHRAGRTGRMGERGVASTLFARDQHSDLVQLERTLGVRMERMREGADSGEKTEGALGRTRTAPSGGSSRINASTRTEAVPRTRMTALAGEILQAQM